MSWGGLLAFSGTAVALLVIPGPSVLFVVSRGRVLGRRAALATVVGNELGLAAHVLAVALGIGAIVQGSVLAFVNDALYGLAAGTVRRWLHRSPRRIERVGGASGLVMIGLGAGLAVSGRND